MTARSVLMCCWITSILFFPSKLKAQPEPDVKRKVQDLQRQIAALQQQLQVIEDYVRIHDSGDLLISNDTGKVKNRPVGLLPDRWPSMTILSKGPFLLSGLDEMKLTAKKRMGIEAASARFVIQESMNHTTGLNHELNIGRNYSMTVGGNTAIVTEQDLMLKNYGTIKLDARSGNMVWATTLKEFYGMDLSQVLGRDYSVNAGGSYTVKTGKSILLESGTAVVIQCGEARIVLNKNGEIEFSGKIKAKGDSDIIIKGNPVKSN